MAHRHRLLPVALLAIAAFAVSGCAGNDPSTPDTPSPQAPAAASAGHAAMAPQTVVATRSAEETPVHAEGRTWMGGCAFAMGQGACRWENGDHAFVELGRDGEPARLAGTVTWTALTPATEELNVYVLHLRDDGNYWYDQDSPFARGPSPLAFDFALSRYNDTQVAFGVSSTTGGGALLAYASAGASQDFVLDGIYTSIVLRA